MLEALALALALTGGVVQADEADETLLEGPGAPADDEADPSGGAGAWSYQFAQPQRVTVGGGKTLVSVESNTPVPSFGMYPVRFFVDNSSGPKQVLQFGLQGFIAGRGASTTREVEIDAGERRVVSLPAPVGLRYGTATAAGPGVTTGGEGSVYFLTHERVVLALASPERFEAFFGAPPARTSSQVMVTVVPPEEAPSELASYVGYAAVVLPDADALERLGEGPRRALEAYAATGGVVVLRGPLRARAAFPLLGAEVQSTQPYGLGRLAVVDHQPDPALFRLRPEPAVAPRATQVDRYAYGSTTGDRLLPQATAPLGRFLLIIAAFTLAIGPGSVWVARRRGTAALLLTMPATAAVTCAVIIGFSLLVDGFSVHAATFGLTRLDARQHRAVTVGLTAYYANLAPGRVEFSTATVPIPMVEGSGEPVIVSLRWRDGLRLGSDFAPSRSYREWGFVSVEPTRARLGVKQVGDGWVVQNALGAEVDEVTVLIDGELRAAQGVKDGAEAPLAPRPAALEARSRVADRFGEAVRAAVLVDPLAEGEFLAQVRGAGFVPTGGVEVTLHDSEHWVRGEVER